MKQFTTLLLSILFLFNIAGAQPYFQGSAVQDMSDANNLKISFRMKPTGNITTGISYLEAAFRYPTATTQAFTITNITSNTNLFPGLAVQRFPPDYVAGGYTYVRFVFNTATIPAAQYLTGTEYPLFTVTTSLPAKPNPIPTFEMASNLVLAQYQFGLADGAGNFIDPGTGAQLYGANFRIAGNDHIINIPIAGGIIPVKFNSFQVAGSDKKSLLNWTVENQDATTSHFEIERSTNGIDFTSIGTVRANLSAGSKVTYTFTDQRVSANASTTVFYYRIKQVDVDGKFVYTGVQSIVLDPGNLGLSLYPDPAVHYTFLSLYLSSPGKINVDIINLEGRKVQGFEFAGTAGLNRKQVDVSHLAAGVYNVIVRESGNRKAMRFVKIN